VHGVLPPEILFVLNSMILIEWKMFTLLNPTILLLGLWRCSVVRIIMCSEYVMD
jgi:hypothetical protein